VMRMNQTDTGVWQDVLRILKESRLLKGFSDEQLQEFVQYASMKTYSEAGQVVASEGEASNDMYIILNGSVEILKRDSDSGQEFQIAVRHQGDHVGELAILSDQTRIATIRTLEPATLLALQFAPVTEQIQEKPWFAHFMLNISLELSRRLASANKKTIETLRGELPNQIQSNDEAQRWKMLIAKGESNTLEFKSTLRYCLKQKSPQKYVEHAVMKTLAAYLNSDGGTLLIGVDDSGAVAGLEHDFGTFDSKDLTGFQNLSGLTDAFLKHFDNLLAASFGDSIHHYLDIAMIEIDGKAICAVTVKEGASDAIWLVNKEKNTEQFYIRRSASTVELSPREAMQYIRDHWK